MNTLFCPSNSEGKKVKEKLQKAGIEFIAVYKESDSTVRLFTENNSYQRVNQIDEHIQSLT
jgi:hypothetical protein